MRENIYTHQETRHVSEPLAEYVSPDLANEAVKHYETRRTPEGLFYSAWYNVELGLNKLIDQNDDARDCYFDIAQELIGMIIQNKSSRQDTLLGALVLSSYLPILRKRSHDEVITPLDCDGIYESLGATVAYLRPLSIDEPPQWRMSEVSVLALAARTRSPHLLLYPTSPREEHSDEQQENHDCYFFNETGKIPLQQKLIHTDKTYSDWITMLTLQPLVDKGLKASGEETKRPLADKVNYLLSLVVAEPHKVELDVNERNFLNFMSQSVVAHYRDGVQRSKLRAVS